jgi:hypothetical protein
MARKSRQLRLQQAQELLGLYEDAGFSRTKKHRFITDMVTRLGHRDITGGQKKFLDSLIEQGAPVVKNQERVDEIKAAMEVDGMEHRREPLEGFARSLAGGWDLSEKQENFLKILLAEAEKVKTEGRYRPSDDVIADLEISVLKVTSAGDYYLAHRPGTAKSFQKVREWLRWTDQAKAHRAHPNPQRLHALPAEPHIDEWSVNKMLKAAKSVLEELKNPKHLPGEMRYYRGSQIALISGAPRFHSGKVIYPVIVGGELVETYMLTKRRARAS